MEKAKETYDIIILGSGPAGLQVAIYTARSNLKTLVLGSKDKTRLSKAHLISNYFGFPDGISGEELLEKGAKQASSLGVDLKEEEAIDVKKNDDFFIVKTSKNEYHAKSILLATGVKNSSSGIVGESQLIGRGISFCVACDGSYFTNKKVAVIGEGDFAAEEAIDLLKYTKDIKIYSDGEEFNISDDLKEKLNKNNVNLDKEKIKEFLGKEKLEAILLESEKKISLDGIFIAKGTPKASDFAYKLGVEIFNDYIKVNEKGQTNAEGVFAAGDVTGKNLQVSYAVGSGAEAAFSIIAYLKSKAAGK